MMKGANQMWQDKMTVMCTHVVQLASEDGFSVILAQTAEAITTEAISSGIMSTAPRGATLLIVSPPPEGESSLQGRVMAALAVLLSTDLVAVPDSGGGIGLKMQSQHSPTS
jgi:hypothetical protein